MSESTYRQRFVQSFDCFGYYYTMHSLLCQNGISQITCNLLRDLLP
mgnify:CR=1 FL=1